jgi:hypothetical protein
MNKAVRKLLLPATIGDGRLDTIVRTFLLFSRQRNSCVINMGVSLPARLATKYARNDNSAFLITALDYGATTRQERPGGAGSNLVAESPRDSVERVIIAECS